MRCVKILMQILAYIIISACAKTAAWPCDIATCYNYTMSMSGLPNMYVHLKPEGRRLEG